MFKFLVGLIVASVTPLVTGAVESRDTLHQELCTKSINLVKVVLEADGNQAELLIKGLKQAGASIVAGAPTAGIISGIETTVKSAGTVVGKTKPHRKEGMDEILESCSQSKAKPCRQSVNMARESEELNVNTIDYAFNECQRALKVLRSGDKVGFKTYGQEMIKAAAEFEKRLPAARDLRVDTLKLIGSNCAPKS